MPKTLRTPSAFLALTLLLAGWLHAWTLPTRYSGAVYPTDNPAWMSVNSYRPLYWVARHLAFGSGNSLYIRPSRDDVRPTGPVAIRTEAGVRIVEYETIFEIMRTENVIAAGHPSRRVYIDEFGLLATSALRKRSLTEIQPVMNLPLLSFSEVQSAMADAYPSLGQNAGMISLTSWILSHRAIVHDALALIALAIWIYSATGIPGWPLWRRVFKKETRE